MAQAVVADGRPLGGQLSKLFPGQKAAVAPIDGLGIHENGVGPAPGVEQGVGGLRYAFIGVVEGDGERRLR